MLPILLSLLPAAVKHAPDIIEGVGKIFGGKAEEIAKDAAGFANTVIKGVQTGVIPPEKQVELQRFLEENEIRLKEARLKELELQVRDAEGGRDVIKTALLSNDPLVRQARPRMMIKVGNACILFSFYAPLCIVAMGVWKVAPSIIVDTMSMIKWIGGFLFSSFMTSFTGYTVARYGDKKIVAGESGSKALNMVTKLGRWVS